MQRPWGGLRGGNASMSQGIREAATGWKGGGGEVGLCGGGVTHRLLQAVRGKVERIRILFFPRGKTTGAVLSNTVATCGCLCLN